MKSKLYYLLSIPPIRIYQRLRESVFKWRTRQIIKEYLRDNSKRKVNIGCGRNVLQGWLNTDIYRNKFAVGQVAYLDATQRFPFEDNSIDYIYSEHIFEHLTFNESCKMLKECLRVLRKDGVMRLAIPHFGFLQNLHEAPEAPVNKSYLQHCLDNNFPNIKEVLPDTKNPAIYAINNFYRDWGHQMMHSYDSLEELIATMGFTNPKRCELGESEHDDLSDLEGHGRPEYRKFYNLQTLAVEAAK